MKWFTELFGLETRADYAEAVVAYLLGQAEGKDAAATESGAVEFASSLVARCFASATLRNVRPAIADLLTPSMMASVGRSLIRSGEAVFLIRSERGGLRLYPASTWEISGEFNPSSWMYKIEMSGPDKTATVTVSEDRVLHFKYSQDPKRPWVGIGPLSGGRLAARLSAESNTMLADLSSGPRGSLLPLPKNPDSTVDDVIAKLKVLRGGMNIVESQNSGWGEKSAGGKEWEQKPIGPSIQESLRGLRSDADLALVAACGIPVGLYTQSDSATIRESYRTLLVTTLLPLGLMLAGELDVKLDSPGIAFNWQRLAASDLQGRARSFQSLTGGGMDADKAARLSGLNE